mmetsp:Transcript_16896/g.31998  ORF Transcript_16896/g.31998 Transcript_16896/m.31998 type:complete len:102 (+) Transcript_16896:44-349(+)
MSFVSQILQPGGGVLLIPFIRTVILCLFATTVTAFFCGVARVHMAILSCLGGGLLLSISFFMNEYDKVLGDGRNNKTSASSGNGSKVTNSYNNNNNNLKTD